MQQGSKGRTGMGCWQAKQAKRCTGKNLQHVQNIWSRLHRASNLYSKASKLQLASQPLHPGQVNHCLACATVRQH
eukprot:353522-Chlamydomonas_euryale.AAC.16